jgi:hypothetical protein
MPAEDDSLLRELGAWARDRARQENEQLDERWDRLAAGSLSPEEEAELRAEAEGSAGGTAALAAFQPLGAEAEARILAQIRAQRMAERPAVATPRPVVASPPAAPAKNVLPFRRRAVVWGGGLGLAAAAVLVAVLNLPGSSAPLPSYVAELKGNRSARGPSGTEAPGIPTFSPGARFELVLRPAEAVKGNVALRCLLVAAGGGPPRPFPACDDVKRSDDGSLLVTGTVGSGIAGPPGAWTLWAIVARPGDLPKDPPVTGVAEPIAGKGWIGIPQRIRFAAAA